MWLEEDSEEPTLKDQIQIWCEETKNYSLSQRIAFVPEQIVQKIWMKTELQADEILTTHGY